LGYATPTPTPTLTPIYTPILTPILILTPTPVISQPRPLIPPLLHYNPCYHHYQFTTDRNATWIILHLSFCLLFMPLTARHPQKYTYDSVFLRAVEKFPLVYQRFWLKVIVRYKVKKLGLYVHKFYMCINYNFICVYVYMFICA